MEILSVGARSWYQKERDTRVSVPPLTVCPLRFPSFLGWRELQRQLVNELDEPFTLIDREQILKLQLRRSCAASPPQHRTHVYQQDLVFQ